MVSPETMTAQTQNKRKATTAGLPGTTRPVKRRASKACCCCRARKVRCDVVENGSPCTNCRLDEVECVVTESKRRKKSRPDGEAVNPSLENSADTSDESGFRFTLKDTRRDFVSPGLSDSLPPLSPSQRSMDLEHHVPHLLYQTQSQRINHGTQQKRMSNVPSVNPTFPLCNVSATVDQLLGPFGKDVPSPIPMRPRTSFPNYIRPLPAKFLDDDIDYLEAKGALTIPDFELRKELIRSFAHYVYPFMPLLDLDEFVGTIARNDSGHQLSLLLFQAVMFAGVAFVPMKYLSAVGFETRKDARKVFFQRARLLYDFDYESDRIGLVQSLLLMTHWYEMPDDQKDTWHWMGVSLSLAHTIGLHRDPRNSSMDARRQRLWKRIWWSTYTRDRLIALGMRRPTRIKDEDCDVPMLTIEDFEIKTFSPESMQILGDCDMFHNLKQQRELALLFIEKSKLCLCISHVLSAQYSVLSHKFGGTTETTMMLVPKKSASEACEVRHCDQELEKWQAGLPEETRYQPSATSTVGNGDEVIHLHQALLRMIFLTTSSALHRPQVLPASPFPTVEAELQNISRTKVRQAAVEITSIAQELHTLDLIRCLPTAGVTVLLPAVIIHLLDIKSNDPNVRTASLHRFYQCMQILQRLREIYASADFATSFLEAAIRKAGLQLSTQVSQEPQQQQTRPVFTYPTRRPNTLTPPPDGLSDKSVDVLYQNPTLSAGVTLTQSEETDMLFASTPPNSVGSENGSHKSGTGLPNSELLRLNDFSLTGTVQSNETTLTEFMNLAHDAEINQNDLDALINFDGTNADLFTNDDALGLDLTMSGMVADTNNHRFNVDDHAWMHDFDGLNHHNATSTKATPIQQEIAHSPLGNGPSGIAQRSDNLDPPMPTAISITGDLDADLGV
ncbi:hypothetical protein AJ80_04374 [Polytolypa hystricis UAMH7299]|uniref:Zn(2)-C6 fungal-type domain-containing protein n=1 Tax=Polytolypa hystricis (strain UAMH7299) TaxID=1447883 RepID=A0A2B7YCD3_POLH7|nr:hypothetical protein AJ80_04374 [Polytolypa hystricis UAMH7299]